jgi:enoyl-CoA hydratase/3-hydroxyacyl-CoA dehydrogenase
MAFSLAGRSILRIAVIGSGNIGPDIALFFSKALAPHGVPVVVHDLVPSALERGRERIVKKLGKGSESGLFRLAEAEAILKNISFTLDKSLLVGCGLVVEAATEKLEVKQLIFEDLERLLAPQAILASNSSHLEPEAIFARLRHPERALVHHFFFPAERNPLVEIVPGPAAEVADWCLRFYEALGKVPVRVKGRYGYAVNPVFEGIFLASLLLEEQGYPSTVIDAVASRALGLTLGPFAVMNLTGGASITQAGLAQYHSKIMPWFRCPESLDEKVATQQRWRTADKGDTVSYSTAMFDEISRQVLGAYFGIVLEILESGVAELGDLELAVETGLRMKPPFAFMNELGPPRVRKLVEDYAKAQPGFKIPRSFGPWSIPYVLREDRGDVAVIRIRRPRTLNSLNREVYRQLDRIFAEVRADPKIRGAVLSGFGSRAFVSGADIEMLSVLPGPEEARRTSEESNAVLLRLETLGKPVVCALNGLSLGGGSELAYACTARIARKGISRLFGQPEVRLGIIPGAGGTQRLPRLVDFAAAWRILRTGGAIAGEEALRLGLISEEVEGDVVDRAVELARTLKPAAGPLPPPKVPSVPPEIDLGGLSRKVDEILRKAILEGAKLPLEKALEFESACFGEAFATRDARIGLDNFLKTGLKQPAVFVHA